MIRQLLQREFLLKSCNTLVDTTERTARKAPESEEIRQLLKTNGVTVEDLEEAKAALQKSIDVEREKTRGKQDKSSFIPGDAVLSLAQSALQKYCEERKPDEIKSKGEIEGFNLQGNVPVTDRELDREFANRLSGDSVDGFFDDFQLGDIGWANCLLAIGVRNLRGTHPFNPNPATPYEINNRARVILFSDWGSGLPRAQQVAGKIRVELENAEQEGREAHIIHLGDVYYSGWKDEYQKNVLNYWSVGEDEADKYTSWCMNGNHDMYSGGKDYFTFLLADPRFKHQKSSDFQNSSFFSLKNDNFIILGLDTGYHDHRFSDPHDLYGEQNEWVYRELTENREKTAILLSHHQPFSAYNEEGENILKKLEQPLAEKLVTAWFWGHEHRCVLYSEKHNIKYPRCIGHGGIPFYVNREMKISENEYEYCEGFKDGLEMWNYFGFVVLDFEETEIKVRYINELGVEHRSEIIEKKPVQE